MTASAPVGATITQRGAARLAAPGSLVVFVAVLGPMSTVPALRRLLIDGHGASASALHWFVAAGMCGSLVGAPWLAAWADRRGHHLALAAGLAVLDAIVTFVTSLAAAPLALVFALRPLHGAASMSTLALLFGSFRGSRQQLVSRVGAAAVAALAIGPALGGALTRLGPTAPFRFASCVSLVLAVGLYWVSRGAGERGPRGERHLGAGLAHARELWAPLALVASQRFAIGGLVASFALHARVKLGFSDAQVGMSFSLLLCLFALGVWWLGRRPVDEHPRFVVAGALAFGGGLAFLAIAPARLVLPTLGLSGLGAAFVYAPSLSLVAARARQRATAMAWLHAAGGLGMVLGPLGAIALDWFLSSTGAAHTGAFLTFSGALHFASALALAPALRRLAAASATAPSLGGAS